MARQKLEPTWIDKDQRAWLEPRTSILEPARSIHATHYVADIDVFDKQPSQSDNLQSAQSRPTEAAQDDFFGRVGA
jgi:hypothetical protein